MEELLTKLDMHAEYVSAVDGASLSPEQRDRYSSAKARINYRSEMSDAEIGCYLSHYGIYERMCREGIELALVLEDDICASRWLPSVVADLAKPQDRPWGVVRLQTARKNIAEPQRPRETGCFVRSVPGGGLFRLDTHVLGGCGYLITLAAARTMLSFAATISRPIDQTLDRFWENGIQPYVVRPFPVWQNPDIPSEIAVRGRARADYQERSSDAWRGRAQRALDSFNKRLFIMTAHAGALTSPPPA